MLNPIEALIKVDPFSLSKQEKDQLFHAAMKASFLHHIQANELFKKYCLKKGVSETNFPDNLSDFPYIPVNLFKTRNLISIPETQVKKTLQSSATSGKPSTVVLDQETSRRQTIVSSKVMSAYLGSHRRPFIVLDEDPTSSKSPGLHARIAATTGFIMFASETHYLLNGENGGLNLDFEKVESSLQHFADSQEEIAIFGFTFILYHHVVRTLKTQGKTFKLSPKTKIIHIGGWKKLEDQAVSKTQFCQDIEAVFGVPQENIIDFYGFTEQMGLVYGSTGTNPKPIHAYADVIIRDIQTLEPVPMGETGFIQTITPIPNSYPGISVLTEDMGRIVDYQSDQFGEKTYFEIIGRAKKAEVRGCGDVMSEYVN